MNKCKQLNLSAVVDSMMLDKNSFPWKVFTAFINGTQISASEEELFAYAVNDLKLDLSTTPKIVMESLPLILVAFMNMWSGWQFGSIFFARQRKKEYYFQTFHKYMMYKMTTILHNPAVKQLADKKRSLVINSSKTGSLVLDYSKSTDKTGSLEVDHSKSPTPANNTELKFSPFAISVECPPDMLNTTVFSNVGDDITMNQHFGFGTTCVDLSTVQLLNWPHVEVSFKTQDICFIRRSATEFVRYLSCLPHECEKIDDNIIEQAESVRDIVQPRRCYSLRLLQEYVKEYMNALKTVGGIPNSKIEEIQTILVQFLEDVKYMKVNRSIATNTIVRFRLSPVSFVRNKKLMKNSKLEPEEDQVGYCEIITPKVELVLIYYKGYQKDTPNIRFEYPDQIKEMAVTNCFTAPVFPVIKYKCTFCKMEFTSQNSKTKMMEHLNNEHKTEEHMRCAACKKRFSVINLASCRWRHKCVSAPS